MRTALIILIILLSSCASKQIMKNCQPTIDGEEWVCEKLDFNEKCK